MAIFFVLIVVGKYRTLAIPIYNSLYLVPSASCILLIHFILQTKFQYIPESLAVVFFGAIIGLITKLISNQHLGDWKVKQD